LPEANQGHTIAYGDDPWTRRLDEVLGRFFGTEVRAFALTTGTAANSLSLATLSPPWGAIYAHEKVISASMNAAHRSSSPAERSWYHCRARTAS